MRSSGITALALSICALLIASSAPGVSPGDVVINEVNVNTLDFYDGSEYIELYNTTASPIDMRGWALAGVEYDEVCGEHYHAFPDCSFCVIPAHGYFIVARDVADGDGFEDRYGFLPHLEMYDGSQTSYEVDDLRVANTIVNHDDFDDQIRFYSGKDNGDYGYRCYPGRYEVLYLCTDSLLTTIIDAMEYTNYDCTVDQCSVNGVNDAKNGYPVAGQVLGRDESSTDTDNSENDFYYQVATPGAQNINNIPPDIWSLRYSPCVPMGTDDVTVSCYATDDDGVAVVKCYYAVCTNPELPDFIYGAYDSVVMTPDVMEDSLFTGTIPQQAEVSYLKFYVKAWDTTGLEAVFPDNAPDYTYTYSVGYTLISDIQAVGALEDSSWFYGQAVNCRGIVTAERGVYNYNTFVIQDGTGNWSGIFVYDGPGTTTVERGDSVTVSGRVSEYGPETGSKTEISLFSGCFTNHGPAGGPPDPFVVATSLLSNTDPNVERYEAVYVRVENVSVTNDSVDEFGTWEINDGSGSCQVGDYAYYVYTPKEGDELEAVEGIFDHYATYRIEPRGNEDIQGPPAISFVRYTPHAPTASDVITVTAIVECAFPIVSVKVFYSTDDGASWDSTAMSASDSLYSAGIGPLPNGSSVEYYVEAWSNLGMKGRRPSAGSYSFYVGRVSIHDIQFPAGGDSSAYAGKPVNTSGIVTAASGTYSDSYFFIMEDYGAGSAEYRGVKVYNSSASVVVARGDSVTVSGDVWEYFGETEISMPFSEAITVHSSGNAHPPAYPVAAGQVDISEQWEGVLVTVDNALVVREENIFGEWTISTGGGAADTCEVGDYATYTYVPQLADPVIVTGIPMYIFGEFYLQPRDDEDICHPGKTGVKDGEIPVTLGLWIQPNPMMSAGVIKLAIPASDRVSVKVFDVTGRLVEVLMDRPVEAGEHKITWDGTSGSGRRATSGIYFVRVETTRGFVTKKMVLSR